MSSEPISPELVLVCPELAPRDPGHDDMGATPAVRHGALRPPRLAATPSSQRAANRELPRLSNARATVGRLRTVLSPHTVLLVVAGAGALGLLSWRALVDFGTVEQRQAAAVPAVHSAPARVVARHASAAVAVESTKRPSAPSTAGTRLAPVHGSRSLSPAKAAATRATRKSSAGAAATKPARDAHGSAGAKNGNAKEVEPAGLPGIRTPTGPLFAPDAGIHLVSRPQLTWEPVANVRGYRIRLYRGRQLLLDVVSLQPKLTLGANWRFGGRRIVLAPATYRWYVWPIPEGSRRASRLLKASSFVLVRPAHRT